MAKDNGGPAFPQNDLSAYGMGPCDIGNDGMSLRDWFAGQALIGVGTWMPTSGGSNLSSKTAMSARAVWAYEQADAMLAARKDTPDEH